ncbi:hypothetical protein [Rhodovulum bhavnagarense]|nr:hypothetical protein [Rhodovulum bhavnagarense]
MDDPPVVLLAMQSNGTTGRVKDKFALPALAGRIFAAILRLPVHWAIL